MRIRFIGLGEPGVHRSAPWLCFRHAVLRAQEGQYIETVAGTFEGRRGQSTICTDCAEEHDLEGDD